MIRTALIRATHMILFLVLLLVLVTLASCKTEMREEINIDYGTPPGTPIIQSESAADVASKEETVEATYWEGLPSTANQTPTANKSTGSATWPNNEEGASHRIKSNKRLTTLRLDEINLKADDLGGYTKEVPLQTSNLTDDKLKNYDGYGILQKEGHISTLYHDANENASNPEELIISTIIRYETDYIDELIKNKMFETKTYPRMFNSTVGEYNIGYFSFDSSAAYRSVYTLEFVKYDLWVQIIVASRPLLVKEKDIINYARIIEARIRQ